MVTVIIDEDGDIYVDADVNIIDLRRSLDTGEVEEYTQQAGDGLFVGFTHRWFDKQSGTFILPKDLTMRKD